MKVRLLALATILATGSALAQAPNTDAPQVINPYTQPAGARSYTPPPAQGSSPQQPVYQQQSAPGYPQQQAYPQQPTQAPQAYPQQQQAYPQQQSGYPQQQPQGYPQQSGYPQQQPQGYPQQSGYPQQAPQAYPQQPGYPQQQPQGQYPAQAANQQPICRDCGIVESMREVEKKGDASGVGAVAGGIGGLILGRQVGNGTGQRIAGVLGAAGGAFAGHQIEKNMKTTKSYEVYVRMEDGSYRTVPMATQPAFRTGERVRLVNGQLQADFR